MGRPCRASKKRISRDKVNISSKLRVSCGRGCCRVVCSFRFRCSSSRPAEKVSNFAAGDGNCDSCDSCVGCVGGQPTLAQQISATCSPAPRTLIRRPQSVAGGGSISLICRPRRSAANVSIELGLSSQPEPEPEPEPDRIGARAISHALAGQCSRPAPDRFGQTRPEPSPWRPARGPPRGGRPICVHRPSRNQSLGLT